MKSVNVEILSYCMESHKQGADFIHSSQGEGRTAFLSEGSLEQGKDYYQFVSTCVGNYELGFIYAAARIELPLCETIQLDIDVIDTETESLLYHIGTEEIKNNAELSAAFSCKIEVLQERRADQVVILTVASWKPAGDSQPEWAARLGYLTEEPFDKPVVVHPMKQESFITYGDTDWAAEDTARTEAGLAGMLRQKKAGEEETINIALFREPGETSDLDYLCKFGKDEKGHPNFTIPSEGSVSLKSGNYYEVTGVTAKCYLIYREQNGAYRVVSVPARQDPNQEISIKSINNVVIWDDKKKWDNSFLYDGGWTEYVFDYLLDILITCKDMSGVTCEYRRQVTSLPVESKYDASVSPVSIMWGCLKEDTLILMESGEERKIQCVQIGERIRTKDGSAEVTNIWKGPETHIIRIRAGEKELCLTGNHPVLSGEGWKMAEKMSAADTIALFNGEYVRVDDIETEHRPATVYNLSCKGSGSASVVAEGFIVGNMEAQNNPGLFIRRADE